MLATTHPLTTRPGPRSARRRFASCRRAPQRPRSRRVSRFAARKLASGFFAPAPTTRARQVAAQLTSTHQENSVTVVTTVLGCAVGPNSAERSRDDCFVYDTVDAQGNVTGTVTTPKTADGSGKAMEGQPMFVPSQADIYANIESARWMNPIGFYNSVKTGGVWDYKQTDFAYMAYGNFHFGVVGRANGWGATALLVGGGQVSQDREFGRGNKLSTGRPVEPYGDSWFDNAAVKAGISFYNENYSSFFFTGFAAEKNGATKLVKRPCNDSEFAAFQAAPTSGK
jgi:hypothetical protein